MAKKLTDFRNPLTAKEGSVFDLGNWLGGILWVVMVGMVIALGVKTLEKIDSFVPGNQTPNVAPYKQEPVATGMQFNII